MSDRWLVLRGLWLAGRATTQAVQSLHLYRPQHIEGGSEVLLTGMGGEASICLFQVGIEMRPSFDIGRESAVKARHGKDGDDV